MSQPTPSGSSSGRNVLAPIVKPVSHQQVDRIRVDRFGEQVTLTKLAPKFLEGVHLFLAFDPFRNYFQAKIASQHGDDADNLSGLRITIHPGDKSPIYFEGVNGELPEAGERRVARTEVVDTETNAQCLQLGEHDCRLLGIRHRNVFRDLEVDAVRICAGLLENLCDLRRQFGQGELLRCDIDGNSDGWIARKAFVPAPELLASFTE